jgi:hypothetical protein
MVQLMNVLINQSMMQQPMGIVEQHLPYQNAQHYLDGHNPKLGQDADVQRTGIGHSVIVQNHQRIGDDQLIEQYLADDLFEAMPFDRFIGAGLDFETSNYGGFVENVEEREHGARHPVEDEGDDHTDVDPQLVVVCA